MESYRKTPRRVATYILFFAIVLSSFLPAFAVQREQAELKAAHPQDIPEIRQGELIVEYSSGTSGFQRSLTRSKNYLSLKSSISKGDIEVVEFPAFMDPDSVTNKLYSEKWVSGVQPNFVYRISSEDEHFDLQWGLHNTGQRILGYKGTEDIDIDMPEAWEISKGSEEIIVAVIDTGVDISHPDLSSSIWVNEAEKNGIINVDDDGNGFVDDVNGWNFYEDNNALYSSANDDQHGTHVAGIISASAGNVIGIAGIVPNVKIMPLKFIGDKGEGDTADAIEAILYAQEMGADVINASWGGEGRDRLLDQKIESFGGIFSAAAGNGIEDIGFDMDDPSFDAHRVYPACSDLGNIVSVAAVDNKGVLSSFSNYGSFSVDLASPGFLIYSTIPGEAYANLSGTSMATPFVSGVAALILSINPSLETSEVKSILLNSVMPLSSLMNKTVTGGLLNANNAAMLAVSSLPDKIPPAVVSTQPENGASGIDAPQDIRIIYDENISAGPNSGSISLKNNNNEIGFLLETEGNEIILLPSVPLEYSSSYSVFLPAGSVQDIAGNPSAEDLTFSFETMSAHTVKFFDWDETLIDTRFAPSGGSVQPPPDPVRTGHIFIGWDKDPIDIYADMDIYAIYEINRYTISFNTMGGPQIGAITGDYGTSVQAPEDPLWEGREFTGWYLDPDSITPYVFSTFPDHDILLYAGWSASVPEHITSSIYEVDRELSFLAGIPSGTSAHELLGSLDNIEHIKIFGKNEELSGSDKIFTGTQIRLMSGSIVIESLTAVVNGDVNGDGASEITDYIQIRSYLLGKSDLSQTRYRAADINENGAVDITDYIKLRSRILGK